MKPTTTLNAEADDPVSHVINFCLGTPVILRAILQQFSNPDLIKLSFVNKKWNYEARSVLKDRGTLRAKIWFNDPPCHSLDIFASDLNQMRVAPFSGVSLYFSHPHGATCRAAPGGVLDPSYKIILDRVPFKKLNVDLGLKWDRFRDCSAFQLVKKILRDSGGVLEELEMSIHWKEVQMILPLLLELIQNCSFPRMKTLKLVAFEADNDFTKFLKAVVALAPNLRELRTLAKVDFNENVLEGSSAVLVTSRYGFYPLYEPMCESVAAAVRGENFVFQRRPEPDFNPALLVKFVPIMLQASRSTLKTLKMDLLFAVPLMCYEICLENVTELEINPDDGVLNRLSPGISALLQGFDFTRVFPKLRKVVIENDYVGCFSPAQIRAFIGQGKAVLKRTLADRAINIKQLTLRSSVSDSVVSFLAQMFPHLETLKVYIRRYNRKTPFTLIFDHFKNLKQLEVEHTGGRHTTRNFDDVFCGIFPEEVAQLREKDDEYLKAVNIVPVMPSLTCMKDLKTLTFRYNPASHKSEKRDPNFIFSKVTGWIGFARCPDRAVLFETATQDRCPQELCHMKPFASVTSVNLIHDY